MKNNKELKPQPTIPVMLLVMFIGMPFTIGMIFDTQTSGFFYLVGIIIMIVMRQNSKKKIEQMKRSETEEID
jgi:hypothetical protein